MDDLRKDTIGAIAVYVYDGRVIAHAADFNRSCPGGFTVYEAQSHRARRRLALEVVRALASNALHENLTDYDCERIMDKMKGQSFVLPLESSVSAGTESDG